LLFFLVQLPLLKLSGFEFRPLFDMHKGVEKVFRLMIPRSLTLLVTQFAITANVFFASFISPRSYSFFELAQTLAVAPVILIGQSIAQASFPSLAVKKEDKKEFLYILLSSFMEILYFTLPISAILIVLRIPVVRLFYGTSTFDWEATVSTGMTLSFFSISIFAQALINLMSRAFYALKDTKTPFVITLFAVCINIILSFLFILVYELPIYYLALSFSLAQIISILLMVIFFDRKITLPKAEIIFDVSKILVAALVMGIALYIPIKLLDRLVFDTKYTINLIFLTGIASFLGIVSYIFFTWLLSIREADYIIMVMKKFKGWKKILRQVEEPIENPHIQA
jgi:putative peptidoglycan lipid II flippase